MSRANPIVLSEPLSEVVKRVRKEYIDKYDGMPPYIGESAYATYIAFLERWIEEHFPNEPRPDNV